MHNLLPLKFEAGGSHALNLVKITKFSAGMGNISFHMLSYMKAKFSDNICSNISKIDRPWSTPARGGWEEP